MGKPIIKRYISCVPIDTAKKDFDFLIKLIKNSGFEYDLQIRDDYFNLYYKGNSLGKIIFTEKANKYKVNVHSRFIPNNSDILSRFEFKKITKNESGEKDKYLSFSLSSKELHPFFSKKHLKVIGQKIKDVNYQEETTFEQMLITDNIEAKDLIIIDRQVADRASRTKMDLLALKHINNNNYQFCILEVKLGNNKELKGAVYKQLNNYIKRIENGFDDYKDCYEKNYIQKKAMGLFEYHDHATINILHGVLGIVVVGGYSGLAEKSIRALKSKHPDIKVFPIKNNIDFTRIK